MGGRGATSATAAANEGYQQDQRSVFTSIAEKAENAGGGSFRNNLIAYTARAAESLYGTERAKNLLENGNFNRLYRDMRREYGNLGPAVMVELDKMLDNSALNKPLGSGYTNDEWQEVKNRVQSNMYFLTSNGYTDYEVAAALAYETKLLRNS